MALAAFPRIGFFSVYTRYFPEECT